MTNKDDLALLVKEIKKGKNGAFEELYLSLYEPLCKFAWRILRCPHLSEEIVQDTFLTIWEKKELLDSNKSIKSLHKSVRNKALNHLKHQKVVANFLDQASWLSDDSYTMNVEFYDSADIISLVNKAVDELPGGAREIYILIQKDGLTYQEISEVLGISHKTAESQMARALKLLRHKLASNYEQSEK
ncbi:MAG: RNA polymerase sigma-70 factor [Balneolales bacterium]